MDKKILQWIYAILIILGITLIILGLTGCKNNTVADCRESCLKENNFYNYSSCTEYKSSADWDKCYSANQLHNNNVFKLCYDKCGG